jgi:hypothetical protein
MVMMMREREEKLQTQSSCGYSIYLRYASVNWIHQLLVRRSLSKSSCNWSHWSPSTDRSQLQLHAELIEESCEQGLGLLNHIAEFNPPAYIAIDI